MFDLEIKFMIAFLVLMSIAFVVLIIKARSECKKFDKWLEDYEARQVGFDGTHDGEQ